MVLEWCHILDGERARLVRLRRRCRGVLSDRHRVDRQYCLCVHEPCCFPTVRAGCRYCSRVVGQGFLQLVAVANLTNAGTVAVGRHPVGHHDVFVEAVYKQYSFGISHGPVIREVVAGFLTSLPSFSLSSRTVAGCKSVIGKVTAPDPAPIGGVLVTVYDSWYRLRRRSR